MQDDYMYVCTACTPGQDMRSPLYQDINCTANDIIFIKSQIRKMLKWKLQPKYCSQQFLLTSQNDVNSRASCSDKKFNPQTFPKVKQ